MRWIVTAALLVACSSTDHTVTNKQSHRALSSLLPPALDGHSAIVIENETGIIEEITLTFVVVKLLDDRGLIVPIARVLEQPFQNWTRQATKLTVSFTLMVGPRLPVAPLRKHLLELAEANPLWDKREASLVVSDLTDRAMVLRVNLSVSRPEHGFVLRNEIREALVTHLQTVDDGAHLIVPRE